MATTETASGQPDLASLITSIGGEAKKMIEQEFHALRDELKEELAKGGNAAMDLGTGAALGGLSAVLLTLMVVHLVQRTTGIPLWLSYGIVGGLLGFTGSGLLAAGAEKAADLRVMPKEASEAIKEGLAASKSTAASHAAH